MTNSERWSFAEALGRAAGEIDGGDADQAFRRELADGGALAAWPDATQWREPFVQGFTAARLLRRRGPATS